MVRLRQPKFGLQVADEMVSTAAGFVNQPMNTKMENSSVSRTSFTLRRLDNDVSSPAASDRGSSTEDDATCLISHLGSLQTSLNFKPWIDFDGWADDTQDEFVCESNVPLEDSLPKRVFQGRSRYHHGQKVMRWQSEDACSAALEEAPVFYPTEEEFQDAVKYIESIREKAEPYGICRIIPPSSWKSCLLKEREVWSRFKFKTQIQQINELQDQFTRRKLSGANEGNRCKRKRSSEIDAECDFVDESEDACNVAKGVKFESGPDFTMELLKKYADDFKARHFNKKSKVRGSNTDCTLFEKKCEPSLDDIEHEYWQIIEDPTEQIAVLSGADLDNRTFRRQAAIESSLELQESPDFKDSHWNLSNVPKLPGSLLPYGVSDLSNILEPRLHLGVCFSSTFWKVEEHHLYTLCYVHFGAPKIWYGVPGRFCFNFEAAVKKHFADFLAERPELYNELVIKLSPSMLKSKHIPAYRCIQNPKEFVLILPGAYHLGFDSGFNCSEVVNFAPISWLPHGQNIVERYREEGTKTLVSHDKLLLGAALEAVRSQWELLLQMKNSLKNLSSKDNSCGKDGILTKALKSRVKIECLRRNYLCSSQSRKMDKDFDATGKRECHICLYDLHLSAACCSCSPERYSCLNHAKQLCSCPWSEKAFLFRYDMEQLNGLVEALEGKYSAVYKCAREFLGVSLHSSEPKDRGSNAPLQVDIPASLPEKSEQVQSPAENVSISAWPGREAKKGDENKIALLSSRSIGTAENMSSLEDTASVQKYSSLLPNSIAEREKKEHGIPIQKLDLPPSNLPKFVSGPNDFPSNHNAVINSSEQQSKQGLASDIDVIVLSDDEEQR